MTRHHTLTRIRPPACKSGVAPVPGDPSLLPWPVERGKRRKRWTAKKRRVDLRVARDGGEAMDEKVNFIINLLGFDQTAACV